MEKGEGGWKGGVMWIRVTLILYRDCSGLGPSSSWGGGGEEDTGGCGAVCSPINRAQEATLYETLLFLNS